MLWREKVEMTEYKELLEIIRNENKIVFWGASETAISYIKGFITTIIGQNKEWTIVDTYLQGKTVMIGEKEVTVENPTMYLKEDVKWIVCVSTKNAYAEVYTLLSNHNYNYGIDFIDGIQFPKMGEAFPHGEIIERDVYIPWVVDYSYREKREHIIENTLVDEFRCYELYKLVQQTQKTCGGDILEVGVWRGGTGALIASALQDINSNCKVYLADTFEGVVKTGKDDIYYKDGAHNDTSEEIVKDLLDKMCIVNTEIIKGIFPDDFGSRFDNKKWSLVHIDVDIYQSAKDVFNYVWPNVLTGGVVVFDDYAYRSTVGVTKLCNELADEVKDGIFIYNLNQHGLFIKV